MMTIDDFVTLVRDELGMPVTAEHIGLSLDEVPGWDSVHLLWLVTAMERETGRRVALPDLLEVSSLGAVHALYVPAAGAA
ncbi:acyl carrier protein [Streptomyces sp. NBC_01618]|nr:acyl carrier protein [Streptomyces sp. NBC_01618]